MSTVTNYPLTAEQQNALLNMLEFALVSAEGELETNTYEYEAGKVSYDPTDFDPGDLEVWLNDSPELARILDAMPEIVENAKILKRRLNALEAKA